MTVSDMCRGAQSTDPDIAEGPIPEDVRGLHSRSCQASRLSAVYEKSIANRHHELDPYIAARR